LNTTEAAVNLSRFKNSTKPIAGSLKKLDSNLNFDSIELLRGMKSFYWKLLLKTI